MTERETSVLVDKFRLVHSAGERALRDFSIKVNRQPFLFRAKSVLQALYGSKAPIVQKFFYAIKNLSKISEDEYTALFREFESILNTLEQMSLRESTIPRSYPSPPPAGRNVFIIHGHDETNTLRLRVLLQEQFSLTPILMMRRPGMSRALLSKYEDEASTCSLAFALITPDDQIANKGNPYFQARPNVIFEVGWFVGRLGIPRVCLLLKDGATVQSDIDGISRIDFRDNIEEKVLDIQRELVAVGLV